MCGMDCIADDDSVLSLNEIIYRSLFSIMCPEFHELMEFEFFRAAATNAGTKSVNVYSTGTFNVAVAARMVMHLTKMPPTWQKLSVRWTSSQDSGFYFLMTYPADSFFRPIIFSKTTVVLAVINGFWGKKYNITTLNEIFCIIALQQF